MGEKRHQRQADSNRSVSIDSIDSQQTCRHQGIRGGRQTQPRGHVNCFRRSCNESIPQLTPITDTSASAVSYTHCLNKQSTYDNISPDIYKQNTSHLIE